MQIAISGHLSQSAGADLSGQHGMSSDIDAMAIEAVAIEALAIEPVVAAPARAKSGANTSPAIRKTASSRRRWIERFTLTVSHNAAAMESEVPSRKRQRRGIINIVLSADTALSTVAARAASMNSGPLPKT